jgi:alkylhydroperoxidase/carboxymuconolactone decarboxylase family protein YurZ
MPENPLATLGKIDPALTDHLKEMSDFIYGPGALPKKVKILIALAFDAAHGADRGVNALARAAMCEGATPQEIAEALRVAYYLAGVGTLYTASAGLEGLIPQK